MTRITVPRSLSRATIGLAALIHTGCPKAEPMPIPAEPAALETRPIRCPAEVRLWLVWHGYQPDDKIAEVCDQLDRLPEEELRSFDRRSPSHIGYHDVRADLRAIIAQHGDKVTVRDLAAFRDDCIGRLPAQDLAADRP